jgi:hypothetical protein
MSEIDLALAFLSGVVTGVPTSVRAKGFRSKPDDNKAIQRPAVGGHGRSPPRRTPGSGRTMRARGEPGWAAAISGEFLTEVRQTGRGERDSPATNDLPITMRLAEPPAPIELVRSA